MLSPSEIVTSIEKSSLQKITFSLNKTFWLAFLAGAYIALGGLLSISLGYGFPGITYNNPGVQKVISGLFFPIGLILVVIAGAELFTGNNAVLIPSLLNRSYGISKLLRNWVTVYIGNFTGALFVAYFLTYLTGIFNSEPWHNSIINMTETKISFSFGNAFLRGVGCNWLVCLAVWLGSASTDMTGKCLGLWLPVMCFVAIGFEHCIANMFFIPLGMMMGANVTISEFLIENLIPVTFGNIVGGALFVGAYYWYVYKRC
ncbi:MAG: formate/nitrite transporter family protein [Bacteroidales bacterium]